MKVVKKYEHTIIILILVLTNFVVKGFFLSSNSLGGDEPFSVYHAQMDIASIIRLLSEGNNPPLYEILLHFWIKIFGISEFSVRFPSLIFSCISVYFIYKTGTKYLNKRIAIYSGIIYIFSNYHILFAHEARVYSLLGMLTVISMYIFMGILSRFTTNHQINKNNRFRNSTSTKFILLAIVNALIIYSHYFGFFVIAVQLLFLIFNFTVLLKLWKQVLLNAVITVVLYFPNILVVFNRFNESSSGTWIKPVENLGNLFDLFFLFSNNSRLVYLLFISILFVAAWKLFYHIKANKYISKFFLIGIIPLFFLTSYSIFFQIPFIWRLTSNNIYTIGFPILVLCVNIIWFVLKKKTERLKNLNNSFIVFMFVFIIFFMFVISCWIPIFLDRYLMSAAIVSSLVLGISADYLIKSSKYKYIITIILISSFIVTVKPNITNKRNVEEAVEMVKSIKDSSTLVLICPSNFVLNFAYYYKIELFKGYNVKRIYSNINNSLNLENVYGINNINQIDYDNWNHIVFLDAAASFSHPDNNIKIVLDENYSLKNKYNVYEIFNIFEYYIEE